MINDLSNGELNSSNYRGSIAQGPNIAASILLCRSVNGMNIFINSSNFQRMKSKGKLAHIEFLTVSWSLGNDDINISKVDADVI